MKQKTVWKSLCLGIKIKGAFSLIIGILGVPAAFLPLLLSRKLQKLTDDLMLLTTGAHPDPAGAMADLLFLGGIFLLQLSMGLLLDYVEINDRYHTLVYVKEQVLRQVCSVHYSYLENRDDFHKRIEFADSQASEEMARSIQGMFSALYQLIIFISTGAALWAVHPMLVLILVFTGIPAVVLSYLQSDETFRFRTKWMEEGALSIHLFHLCASSDHGIQEVRHYELGDYLKARWRAMADTYIQKKNRLVAKHLRYNLLADFLRSGVYLVVLLVTARAIYRNPALGLGVFTLVYTLSNRMQQATGNIFTAIMQFSASLAYMKEFFALDDLDRDEKGNKAQCHPDRQSRHGGQSRHSGQSSQSRNDRQIKHHDQSQNGRQSKHDAQGRNGRQNRNITQNSSNRPGDHNEPNAQGYDIEFKQVSFTYPDTDREVLHDITLSIRAGEKIAIVGDNGSGKSTFISLLTGMLTPDRGEVCIGGLNMEEHKSLLRQELSVVFQDFAHYEANLRENITVSDTARHLSDGGILDLARQIHVEDVILEQPEGLDGMLGHLSQKGNDLSGGQWQKIALLRAVYRDQANILILDEPTAALDPKAETQLYRDFSRITGEKTTLLISHRLGITSLVDRILVFRDGRIIEDGTHQELMAKRGHYHSLYQAQAKWYQ